MSLEKIYVNFDAASPDVGRLLAVIGDNTMTDDCSRTVLISKTYEELNKIKIDTMPGEARLNLLTIITHLIIRFISVTTDGVSSTSVPTLWVETWCRLVNDVSNAINRNIRWCELLFTYNTIVPTVNGRAQYSVKNMDTITLIDGDENERQFVKTITWLEAINANGGSLNAYLDRPEVKNVMVLDNRERYYIAPIAMFSRINSPQLENMLPNISVSFFAPTLNEIFGINGETFGLSL